MCPGGKDDLGMLCLKKGESCTGKILSMTLNVVKNIVKIAALANKAVSNPADLAKNLLEEFDKPFDFTDAIRDAFDDFNYPVCTNYEEQINSLPPYL